jgi:hypothetical protein
MLQGRRERPLSTPGAIDVASLPQVVSRYAANLDGNRLCAAASDHNGIRMMS